MGINYCAAFGTLLALTCGILIAIGAVLPEFVDVFLVKDASDPDATDPVAGVGVFNSEYDPSNQDPDVLAASGAPTDKFSTPTLEFPLLFPAQENFVADVLPLDGATAATFGNTAVAAPFDAVQALEFDDCSQYIPAAVSALEDYFDVVGPTGFNLVLAAVNQAVATELAAELGPGLAGTINVPALIVPVLLNNAIAAGCSGQADAVTEETLVTSDVATCVSDGFSLVASGTATAQPIGASIATLYATVFSSECEDTQTVAECFATVDVLVADTQLDGAIAPSKGDVTTSLCGRLDTTVCNENSFLGYLQFVLGLATEFQAANTDLEPVVDALTLFFGVQQAVSGFVVTSSTLNELVLNAFAADPTFPTEFTSTDSFEQCRLIGFFGLAAETGDETTNKALLSDSCTMLQYFNVSIELYQDLNADDAVNTAGLVATLFGQCIAVVGTDGTGPASCSNVFAQRFLDGAYGGDIGNGFADSEEFEALALSECEDDVEDNDKIAQAQKMLIGSFVFYGLTLVLAAANLVLGGNTAGLLGASGVGAILAGGLTFGALLTVRSAPVYEGVGDAADANEPFYQEGKVVAIATAAALMELAAGICFLVGIYFACNATPSLEEEEVEEKRMVPKKEEKEDVPEVKAAEPEAEADEEKAAPEAGQVSEKDL